MNKDYNFIYNKELRDEFLEKFKEEIQRMVSDGLIELAISHRKTFDHIKQDFEIFY